MSAVARNGVVAWDRSVEAGVWVAVSPRNAFFLIDAERLWLYSLCLSAIVRERWIGMPEGPSAYTELFAWNCRWTWAINHSIIFLCIRSIRLLLMFPRLTLSVTHRSRAFTRDSEAVMGIVGNGETEARARVRIGPGGRLLTLLRCGTSRLSGEKRAIEFKT